MSANNHWGQEGANFHKQAGYMRAMISSHIDDQMSCKRSGSIYVQVSREGRMPEVTDAGDGAPTVLIQNLTGGELQDQNEIFISSCKSCGETSFQARIYAIIGLTCEADSYTKELILKPQALIVNQLIN